MTPTYSTAREFSRPGSLKFYLQPWTGRSDQLVLTEVNEAKAEVNEAEAEVNEAEAKIKKDKDDFVRDAYLPHFKQAHPPIISSSNFVPPNMIEHLMRNKRDKGGMKFEQCYDTDKITNMEGALHTYVCPIAPVAMHGDHAFIHPKHTVNPFADINGKQQARTVVMSALVLPDFANEKVMLKVCQLAKQPIIGDFLPYDFTIMSTPEKHDETKREEYDNRLHRHMVASLVEKGRLPSMDEVHAISRPEALSSLKQAINGEVPVLDAVREVYVEISPQVIVSLELLFNSAVHQAANEFSVLEQMCPQGYVYTFNPPAIYAKSIDATLLNRIQFAALRFLSDSSQFNRMRVYAFSDYADKEAINLLKSALANQVHAIVMRKDDLFSGPEGHYDPPKEGEGALLVVHSNGDGFGQNIETEGTKSSLDGAIGSHSSAAASLHRKHPYLTSYLI